ncbi:Piso0_001275 [Millerozyma farinosa CBS 7064]|uniref:Piso0_001275 protein n=1 Tax=Pichia sorbitophila (strain ATCC MYA-4447 / BCRC 22081 / CBS 7064 / NBRC 10061 / NRRL Y-12695) TaxID=559304 RepID=G8YMQ6_PICSO|nr:Piso0_001275 [Millerozyma farinosa CBS 7064]
MGSRLFEKGSLAYRASEITNNLDNLVSIGTLNVWDVPKHISPLGGIGSFSSKIKDGKCIASSEWKWLDIDYLLYLCGGFVNQYLKCLQFLVKNRFVVATYKISSVPFHKKLPISISLIKVRLYAIPSDIQGARFVNSWTFTNSKPKDVERRIQNSWLTLMELVDFTRDAWVSGEEKTLYAMLKKRFLLLSCSDFGSHKKISQKMINRNIERWVSNQPSVPSSHELEDSQESLLHKIQALYNSIRSPFFDKEKLELTCEGLQNERKENTMKLIVRLLSSLDHGDGSLDGLKTDLYPFQMKSLCKMLEKESDERKVLVPNFIKLQSNEKQKVFYYDIDSGKVFIHPEYCILPRGGILAENMGLGKTLICLSLICTTKYDVAEIPRSYLLHTDDDVILLDEPPHRNNIDKAKPPSHIKTLRDFCIESIMQNSVSWRYYFDDLPTSVQNALAENPGYFKISLEDSNINSNRSRSRKSSARLNNRINSDPEGSVYRTLYLCHTTIIIVPDNLLNQWRDEIQKHVIKGFLSILYLSRNLKNSEIENEHFRNSVPQDLRELIKFDVIIITQSLISKYYSEPESSGYILDSVYWKRLIIDEGHSVNSRNSRNSIICKNLYSERRWAVTGTPTSGLTNLHMDEQDDDSDVSKSHKKSQYVIKSKFNERDDLTKLGVIIGDFLKIEPFGSCPKLWSSAIMKPFMSDKFSSAVRLLNLLNEIMVRHSSKSIDADLKLPQLHHHPVFLEPSFHNRLSINLFTAVLAVNAVSSERRDIDYMFHPANRQQLRKLISNLQRATFHWTGFDQKDVETLIHISKFCLNKKSPDGTSFYNNYDMSLLKKSLAAAEEALSNVRWKVISLLHEMCYSVYGLPHTFIKNFGIGTLETDEKIGVFGAPHLLSLQEFYYKHRFVDFNKRGAWEEKMSSESKTFWERYWKYNIKQNVSKFTKDTSDYKIGSSDISDALSNPKTKVEETEFSNTDGPGDENGEAQVSSIFHEFNDHMSQSDIYGESSDVKDAIILGTASSKLSYLTSKLIQNQRDSIKSIVFFEFEDSAYYLTELLDVVGVEYILYATSITSDERAKNLDLFKFHNEKTEGGIALVMDLKLAAQGLTIIAATRVYFINPVWERYKEAQAIKRAHRIGQKKDVYVETLVLKGTLEEEIYNKRKSHHSGLTQNESEINQKKFVIDDFGMQEFILKHEFLDLCSQQTEFCPFFTFGSSSSRDRKTSMNSDAFQLNTHTVRDNSTSDMKDYRKLWDVYLFNRKNHEKIVSNKMHGSHSTFQGQSPKETHKRPSGEQRHPKRVKFQC